MRQMRQDRTDDQAAWMAHRMDLESSWGSACSLRRDARDRLRPEMEPALRSL